MVMNKFLILTKITSNFYCLVFLGFFASTQCIAKITTDDVFVIVKKSIEEQATLEYLAPYRELIFITLKELFDQHTGKFLFATYKTELQNIKQGIKGNYTTQASIATIPVGPETLQAKYVLYNIISHKVFLGLIINFIAPVFNSYLKEEKLKHIISQHDISKLKYIEGYQQLYSLLESGYQTAKKLIDATPDSDVYRAMNEHKRLSSHHPRYWWEVKGTRNIPNEYLIEMFADQLSIDLHRGGEQKTTTQKIDHYKEYLLKNKFGNGKEWEGKYLLMKKLFEYAEKIQIKYRNNTKKFGSLIGLID
jgi:hypothetical protein